MKPTRTRLIRVAAALSTIAIAFPVSTAAAATAADGPASGQATISGATYITTAPSTFINTNNQSSSSTTSLGDQYAT